MATVDIEHAIERTEEELYRCSDCGDTFDRDGMAPSSSDYRPRKVCRSCAREQRNYNGLSNDARARTRAGLGHAEWASAPDPRPAQLLIGLLALERERGVPFEEAWARSKKTALQQVRLPVGRVAWNRAWEFLEPWAGSYFRRDDELPPLQLSSALVPDGDGVYEGVDVLS